MTCPPPASPRSLQIYHVTPVDNVCGSTSEAPQWWRGMKGYEKLQKAVARIIHRSPRRTTIAQLLRVIPTPEAGGKGAKEAQARAASGAAPRVVVGKTQAAVDRASRFVLAALLCDVLGECSTKVVRRLWQWQWR